MRLAPLLAGFVLACRAGGPINDWKTPGDDTAADSGGGPAETAGDTGDPTDTEHSGDNGGDSGGHSGDPDSGGDTGPDREAAYEADVGGEDGDPCTLPLWPDAAVVSDELTTTEDALHAWVCRHGTWSGSGADLRVAVEAGGSAVLNGTRGIVWARAGADVGVLGDHNTAVREPRADVYVEGEDVEIIECEALSFELDAAPSPGC